MSTDGQTNGGLTRVRGVLADLGARARWTGIARVLFVIALAALGALLLAAAGDAWIRFPGWLRGAQLVIALVLLAWAVRRWLVPALRFHPSPTQIALRVERRSPELRGRLAAAVELEGRGGVSLELVSDVTRRFAVPEGVVDRRAERRSLAAFGAVLAVWGVLAVAVPSFVGTGLVRVLVPFADVSWPKRTEIVDATRTGVHPAGVVLPLRAVLARSPGDASVRARYRLVDARGNAGRWRSAVLIDQRREATFNGAAGPLFETLIETTSLGPLFGDDGSPATVEYELTSGDDNTARRGVRVAPPPEVASVVAEVTLPAYARDAVAAASALAYGPAGFVSGVLAIDGAAEGEMGGAEPAGGELAIGPVLAGSDVVLELKLSKPVPAAGVQVTGVPRDALELSGGLVSAVSLRWRAESPVVVRVSLEDEFGLLSSMSAAYPVDVVIDEPPTSVMLEPERDESVLPTAVVPLVGEGMDDVGLSSVAVMAQLARPIEAAETAGAEAFGDAVELRREAVSGTAARVGYELALETLDVRAGDEVRVFVLATDVSRREVDGEVIGHGPVASTPRVLRVIGRSSFVDELLAELGAVRRGVIRLDDEQATIDRRLENATPSERDVREQAALGESVRSLSRVLDGLSERFDRNRLDDEIIRGLVEDAGDAARRGADAADRSAEAAQAEREAERESGREEERAAAAERGDQARAEVREELERLAGLLDRGEDSWAVRRALEDLIESQRQIGEETERVGDRTRGRATSQLDHEELTELEKIAQRQLEAAERARELLEELSDRSEEMEDVDAGQSAAMRGAAQRGRESQVAEQLEQAGRSLEQNQINQAGASQQAAQRALEEMLRDLDEADRQRNAELQRLLASLIQSLEGLINRQKGELSSLAQAEAAGRQADRTLSQGMEGLHANTLGVIDDVQAELAELRPVADQMEVAASAQGQAVVPLREVPVAFTRARDLETESLGALEEALRLAEEAQAAAEADEADEARQELIERYGALLEEQVSLRAEAEALGEGRLGRRERTDARAIGQRQDGLGERIEQVRRETSELSDSPVFSLAHDRLRAVTGRAAERLRQGSAGRVVTIDQSSAVRLLQGLIDALESESPEPEDFREGGGGSGESGQQGSQGVIPPIAELKALRLLQQEALDLTKLASDGDVDVEQAAAFQRRIADEGLRVLEAVQNGGAEPGAGPGAEPELRLLEPDDDPLEIEEL
ncbi:MAG: hypothetical protein AAF108_04075 [Planctomycetota bacterium]